MESLALEAEVRLKVNQYFRTLSTSLNNVERIAVLQMLGTYLDDGPESPTSPAQREEFRKNHYSRTLQLLIANISADWLQDLTVARRTELWDGLFLRGPPEQALLVLMEGLGALSPSAGLDLLVKILETFLQSGRLAELLWSYCQGAGPSDSPQLRESLLGKLAALSDLTANRLYPHNKVLFLPQQYYPLLAREILTALERTCQALRDSKDCSLNFVAQTLGKVCIQGHSGLLFAVMAPRLSSCTHSDMVWQRVCWKLVEKVPERWLESMLSGLVLAVNGPEALSRIIGNLVLKNKKAQYVITYKLVLLQYKYETRVLRILLGYLAMDPERRPLLCQLLRSVCQAWANPSAVRHTPLEQQLYISQALLLCVGLLSDKELDELRPELLHCLLGGIQSHLDSSVLRIRQMGMVVGECLSSRVDATGTRLKFEYDHTEETRQLVALMTPLTGEKEEPEPEPDPEPVIGENSSQETNRVSLSPQDALSQSNPRLQPPVTQPDSDLDSDDDLTPYDMSGDQKMSEARPPRYLRDCLEVLLSSEDPMRLELSLRAVEDLVRKNISTTKEVSVQLTKVLLHMVDKYSIPDFLPLRHGAMVALAVTDCLPVVQYLTAEFYALNYSLRQRLDMLEVLGMSAQELSQPVTSKGGPSEGMTTISDLTPYPGDDPVHWRQVVEKRIQSKTRRLRKGVTHPPAKVTPNRYAPVAGYFFFPLLCSSNKPKMTLDLLGIDHFVLGRLIHTLGLLVHLAVNAPIAPQMGCALLDFVWTMRYHVDQTVRQGVLFAICSVFLSMPSHDLLQEFGEQLMETRTWLTDVAEGDADVDCRSLAIHCLVLLDENLKKQLDPQTLALQS